MRCLARPCRPLPLARGERSSLPTLSARASTVNPLEAPLVKRISSWAAVAVILVVTAVVGVRAFVTPTFKIQWDQQETVAASAQFQYTVSVDGTAEVVLAPACVALSAPPVNSRCTAPLTPLAPAATHTLVVKTYNGFGSAPSSGLTGGPPAIPLNVTVIVIVS